MIFIIAEIGINHNGDIELAKKLVRMASFCGCDAVKFQKREVELVYTKEFLDSPRQSPWGTTQRDQKNGIELSKTDYIELRDFCDKLKIEFGASSWDIESQNFINSLDPDFNKIASPMLTNTDLLKNVSSHLDLTYISTGMSTKDEISKAVEIFRNDNCRFELMHCVSVYPMDTSLANLNRIKTLRDTFKCSVGYSGHEVGLGISVAACALGITSLERHITLDRSMYGSDQSASVEMEGLRKLVKYSKEISNAMGDGSFGISEQEELIREKLRN